MPDSAPAPFQFLPLGAIIQSILIGPSNHNIVHGFPKQAHYTTHNGPYFGETIGRVANRISDGKINSLAGQSWPLVQNDKTNCLHGGENGWGKRVWDGPTPVGVRKIPGLEGELEGGESVKFTLRDGHGEEGFPGTVLASVVYTAGTQKTAEGKEVRVLGFEYEVELVGDEVEETVVNVTNHSYFNLSSRPTIDGTEVSLTSNTYLPRDPVGAPSGGPAIFSTVTPNETFTLGVESPDIDDCFIVSSPALPLTSKFGPTTDIPLDTRSSPLNLLVKAYHPDTEIHLDVLSTEPAFQFYTGEHINVEAIEGEAPARGKRAGFCVEPSRYVNAINIDEWRGQVVLKKGEVYGSRVVYRGWSDE